MPRTKMTPQEKAERQAVKDYLGALADNAPKRGRKRTADNVNARITAIGETMNDASAIRRLSLVQERLDLEAEIETMARATRIDMGSLETGFIKAASSYGSQRGISYAAWREMGVPANTLKAAGIRRTRRSSSG